MKQKIGYVALLVDDYDAAISYYTTKLKFNLIEDTDRGNGKRWVLIAPAGSTETCLLLAKASGNSQQNCLGNQTGGRVSFFLHTDNFWNDYNDYKANGVVFIEEPREEAYGTVAVFKDLYGNKWDLLELKNEL